MPNQIHSFLFLPTAPSASFYFHFISFTGGWSCDAKWHLLIGSWFPFTLTPAAVVSRGFSTNLKKSIQPEESRTHRMQGSAIKLATFQSAENRSTYWDTTAPSERERSGIFILHTLWCRSLEALFLSVCVYLYGAFSPEKNQKNPELAEEKLLGWSFHNRLQYVHLNWEGMKRSRRCSFKLQTKVLRRCSAYGRTFYQWETVLQCVSPSWALRSCPLW